MEWVESIGNCVNFIEKHLFDDIDANDVAESVNISSFYLQKGFKIMTGYTIAEYIRYRRLYLAALDTVKNTDKIIDISYKYFYDTPESFSKAFKRFHGVLPAQLHGNTSQIRLFLPLKIKVSIQGGYDMDYIVEKMSGFKVVGFEREFSFETSYQEIPKFWSEISEKYIVPLWVRKKKPENKLEQLICDCTIGEYGVCIDDSKTKGNFRYLIAGEYHGGDVPEGLTVYEFPETEWAKFRCIGPMPGSLQSVNTKIFKEWLPGNADYEIAMGCNIEWYGYEGKTTDPDYESAIWIPVKRK